MDKIYCIKFNKNGTFERFDPNPNIKDLPQECFLIDSIQHEKYLNALNSNKDVILIKGEIKIVDKDPKELEKINQQKLISEAQMIYNHNSYRWNNQIIWLRYSESDKNKIIKFHDDLLDVISGNGKTLPILDLEIKNKQTKLKKIKVEK